MSQSGENCPQDIGSSIQEGEPTAYKIGNLDDPFEYAPKKPDGDYWEILLKPLFEEDKAQCSIWKDEVSNLLIFAGLFSAVVTAFIIESYKSLQRDPNQDVIALLSQIVDRLGTNASAASSPPSPPLPSFSPSSSSIRINIFWFISLILSLTTVLVGIISLQWLREHQNYATLTPRQQYAIFHMRKEGFQKWHVGKIFTAMPLLLQSALVLFFTGIIDFLLVFGDIAVVIPVAVVIGLTLLFLVATMLLPTVQGLYLFLNFSIYENHRNTIPVQCPYKSPQSNVIRAMSLPIFKLFRILYPYLHRIISTKILPRLSGARSSIDSPIRILSLITKRIRIQTSYWLCRLHLTRNSKLRQRIGNTFIRHINYSDRSWLDFDLQWLAIRDGFMRCAFNRPLEDYEELGHRDSKPFIRVPIWDILQGLVSQIHPDISSAYHAYIEVSDKIFSSGTKPSAFVYDALEYGDSFASDVNFFEFYEDFSNRTDYTSLARHQTLSKFLDRIFFKNRHLFRVVGLQEGEIYLRLMVYLYTNKIPVLTHKHNTQNGQMVWPHCLKDNFNVSLNTIGLQVMLLQLITTLFTKMYAECTSDTLVDGPITTSFIRNWQRFLDSDLIMTDRQGQRAIAPLLDLMNKSLIQEMDTVIVPGSGTAKATLPFYASAIFAWQFIRKASGHGWKPSFEKLLSTIRQYKDLTIDKGMSDEIMERELCYFCWDFDTFTADWWSLILLEDDPLLDSSTIDDILSHNNAQPLPPDTSSAQNVVYTPAEAEPHVSINMDSPANIIPE